MLSPQSWLPFAEGLEIGRKRRHNHDCGPGKTLIVSRDERGYSAYCWRCSDHGNAPGPQESLADKLARLARLREADSQLARQQFGSNDSCLSEAGCLLPGPATYDVDSWPTAAALWFYRAGLGRGDIGKLGAYYHADSGRVVLTVRPELDKDGTVPAPAGQACGDEPSNGIPILTSGQDNRRRGAPLFWQARALDGRQPKYLNPPYRPPSMIARWGSAPSPTLCEDILSAYKVGLVGEGWAVMGTSVPSAYVAELMRRQCVVNIWLDPDVAGRRAAAKYKKQLQAYGLQVRDIKSTLDPKKHSREEIKEYLDE